MEKLAEYDVYEELVMDYSPILGVTYGLKNVLVEVDSTEEEEKEESSLVERNKVLSLYHQTERSYLKYW